MACQCNTCVGTGKCQTCSGTGQVEKAEVGNAGRAGRDRFYFSRLPRRGSWRYQALAAMETPAKPLMGGEAAAKGDALRINPACTEANQSCSSECWRPCDKCQKLVCERHDYLVPVWRPAGGACEPADMVCKECIAALWCRGDISQSTGVQ